jgi:hypothetical protein
MMPRKKARIRLKNNISEPFLCTKGLPQGTTLACLIFSFVFDSLESAPSLAPTIGSFSYEPLPVQQTLSKDFNATIVTDLVVAGTADE